MEWEISQGGTMAIKGILLDSGKVLNGPATGHWFISPNFFRVVNKEKFDEIDRKRLGKAFHKAYTYIEGIHNISTKAEEYEHFKEFYSVLFHELQELKISDSQVHEITHDLVHNPKKYVFYEDVSNFLHQAKEKYKLAVVSDAWPSLIDVFEEVKYHHLFDSFVVSSIIGVCKPHALMYTTALNELCLEPEEAVFIDDSLENCLGAKALGINPILLIRDKVLYETYKKQTLEVPMFKNLTEADAYIRDCT